MTTDNAVSAELTRAALACGDAPAATHAAFRLSRRQFLAAASVLSTGVAAAARAAACLGSGELSICYLSDPVRPPERRGIRVTLGTLSWEIVPHRFSERARAAFSASPDRQRFALSLSEAGYPGLDLSADFDAEIYRSNGDWSIRLNFDEVRRIQEFRLSAWMGSDAAAAEGSAYRAEMRGDGRYVKLGRRAALAGVNGNLRLGIDAGFNWHSRPTAVSRWRRRAGTITQSAPCCRCRMRSSRNVARPRCRAMSPVRSATCASRHLTRWTVKST